METNIGCSEPSSRAFERETATSAEQWSNWTTSQICSAIEDERERTFELLTELLVRIQKDVIPEVVATLPALRGPVGPAGPRNSGDCAITSGSILCRICATTSPSNAWLRLRSASIQRQHSSLTSSAVRKTLLSKVWGDDSRYWMSDSITKPPSLMRLPKFVIDNRPGSGGNIGTEAVVLAPADGYTLLLVGAWNAINATLYDKLNFNFLRDIAPVASVIRNANVMVVNPLVPVKTVPEFIAYAKANPGKLNMASPGNGSPPHVTGELFKMMTGINMVHVPYRSVAAGITDMLSGQVQVTFGTTASTIAYIRAGTLRALAVTTATRSEALPDLPTIAEFVPGYEASAWFGVGAPRNTPTEIVNKLNTEINACLADPSLKARLVDLGGITLAGSPADFARLIVEETAKWAKVVKFSGVKAE